MVWPRILGRLPPPSAPALGGGGWAEGWALSLPSLPRSPLRPDGQNFQKDRRKTKGSWAGREFFPDVFVVWQLWA